MSEVLGQDDFAASELAAGDAHLRSARRNVRTYRPRTLVPVPDVEPDEEETPPAEAAAPDAATPEAAALVVESRPTGEYLQELLLERGLDDPALRLRELAEVERMRDLEIARLEQELAEKSDRIFELETALFHAERRGDDLDRRWNDLALTYELTAARLVEAGGRLEAIEHQTGYRIVLGIAAALRSRPKLYHAARTLGRRVWGALFCST